MFDFRQLSRFLQDLEQKVVDAPLEQVIVAQSQRNIDEGLSPPMKDIGSFRDDGKPLFDTGNNVRGTLFGTRQRNTDGVAFILMGSLIALYHQEGFKTEGPNFIPLTIKARRTHVTGNNPEDEGLERGVDYFMAWKGVDVPARRFFRFGDREKAEILQAVQAALAA